VSDPAVAAAHRAVATVIDNDDNSDSLLVLAAREALKSIREIAGEDITEPYEGEEDTFVAGYNAALRQVREHSFTTDELSNG